MIVLDTNVISELIRVDPSNRVVHWIDYQYQDVLFVTAITLAEALYGIERLPPGRRKTTFMDHYAEIMARRFPSRVLNFDERAATMFAVVSADRERSGKRMETADAQIAGICRSQGAALATRNTKDFEGTGVELINPWNEQT